MGPYQQPVRPQQSFRGGGQGGSWQGQRTPRPYWAGQNPRGQGGPQTNFSPRAMMGQLNRWRPPEPTTSPFQRQRQWPQQGQMRITGKCNKCGRNSHQHPNYCPAINSNCNVCNKRDTLRVFAELRHEAQPGSRIDLNEGAHCLEPAGAVGISEVVNIVQYLGPNLVMLLLKLLRTQ